MITSKQCSDCLKENVCKHKDEYLKNKETVTQLCLGVVTNIHISCKEFSGKPNIRDDGNDCRKDDRKYGTRYILCNSKRVQVEYCWAL